MNTKYNVEIKNLPDSEVEIVGEIPADVFEQGRETAIKSLGEGIKVDGFRDGHVPEKVLVDKIGEHAVLEKMADIALQKVYPEIIEENKIKAIGYPQIEITKIAKGNPLGFKAKTSIMPEMKLPDYMAIAKGENEKKPEEIKVEDAEVNQTVEQLRKMRATKEKIKGEDGKEIEKEVLPELNDEFAKSVGKFDSLDALKKSIKENMVLEKQAKAKDKKRLDIMDKIVAGMKAEAPKAMIDFEINKMLDEMKHNISGSGMKWDDYLKHIKKTEEELTKEWKEPATKRVKFGMALDAIADEEKVEVPEEELVKESVNLIAYYKRFGQDISQDQAKAYLHRTLRNEKVFKLLGEEK